MKDYLVSKRRIHFIILLFIIFCHLLMPSCRSRKTVCDANRQYKTIKVSKNRNRHEIPYKNKPLPVKKDYIIRNVH